MFNSKLKTLPVLLTLSGGLACDTDLQARSPISQPVLSAVTRPAAALSPIIGVRLIVLHFHGAWSSASAGEKMMVFDQPAFRDFVERSSPRVMAVCIDANDERLAKPLMEQFHVEGIPQTLFIDAKTGECIARVAITHSVEKMEAMIRVACEDADPKVRQRRITEIGMTE